MVTAKRFINADCILGIMNPRDAYAGGIKQSADAIKGIGNSYLPKSLVIAQPFDNKSGTIKFMEELIRYFALKGVFGPSAYLAAVDAKANNKYVYYIGDSSIDVVPQSVDLAERKRDEAVIRPFRASSTHANKNGSSNLQQRKDPDYLKRLHDYVSAVFGQMRQRVYDSGRELFSKLGIGTYENKPAEVAGTVDGKDKDEITDVVDNSTFGKYRQSRMNVNALRGRSQIAGGLERVVEDNENRQANYRRVA